jgi:hypothetical protein
MHLQVRVSPALRSPPVTKASGGNDQPGSEKGRAGPFVLVIGRSPQPCLPPRVYWEYLIWLGDDNPKVLTRKWYLN